MTTRALPPMGLTESTSARPNPGPSKIGQTLRASSRAGLALSWTGVAAVVQATLLWLPGRGKVVFARVYWSVLCRVMGLRVRMVGTQRQGAIVFACNHSSWLDILVLGGRLEACFVAKAEVGRWPVIRTVARLGRTVFVSRRASDTGRERDGMRARLDSGDCLILFPEGTSSDGSRVLPFRSAFFSVVEERMNGTGSPSQRTGSLSQRTGPLSQRTGPLIQPVSIVYDRLAGLPTGRVTRPMLAWYGDMELGSHFWRLARYRGLRATVILHPPVDPAAYTSRKALSQAVWQTVAEGAAVLRQNRQFHLTG